MVENNNVKLVPRVKEEGGIQGELKRG